MTPEERLLKKRREAERLRSLSPEATVRMGFELVEFGRALRSAADAST